jgi:hypothetical protein
MNGFGAVFLVTAVLTIMIGFFFRPVGAARLMAHPTPPHSPAEDILDANPMLRP